MKNRSAFLRWGMDRKALAVGLLMLLGLSALHAEISNSGWKALTGQGVTLEKKDGSDVAGKLADVGDTTVVIEKASGRVVTVAKADVEALRLDTQSIEEAPNDLWQALTHLNLVLEKADGSEVRGTLDSYAEDAFVILRPAGKTVSVARADVQGIVIVAAVDSRAAESSEPSAQGGKVAPVPEGIAVSAGVGASKEFMLHPYYTYNYYLGTVPTSYQEWYESLPTGIVGFVDLTYLQLSVGYMFVSGGTHQIHPGGGTSFDTNFTYVTLAAHLKYPFGRGGLRFFPLLGCQYRLNLAVTDGTGKDLKSTLTGQQKDDLNELWIQGGAGIDIVIGPFYIRPEVLAGFKPLGTSDHNLIKANEAFGYTDCSMWYLSVQGCLLVGYRF